MGHFPWCTCRRSFVNILVHKVKYYLHNVFVTINTTNNVVILKWKQAFNSDLHHPQNQVCQQTALLYAVILFPMHRVFALQTETHERETSFCRKSWWSRQRLSCSLDLFETFPRGANGVDNFCPKHRSAPLISDKVMSVYTKPFRQNRSINLKGLLCKLKINISLDVAAYRG